MEEEQQSEADEAAPLGAAQMLREAREARQLDLAAIAGETRIPQRHLEAIEEGRFTDLPSRTYALGFSRTYARAVGLDDDHIARMVREELSDEYDRHFMVGGGMEPGDPAKLPSAGLAWFGAIAAVLLVVGAIAFFSTYFGAGEGPASLLAGAETGKDDSDADQASSKPAAPAKPTASQQVVFTALTDNIWVRFYEQDGERLYEKVMNEGDRFELPKTASDPRINTAVPDQLAITIGGQSVPKLAEEQRLLDGTPVSAKELLARSQAPDASSGSEETTN